MDADDLDEAWAPPTTHTNPKKRGRTQEPSGSDEPVKRRTRSNLKVTLTMGDASNCSKSNATPSIEPEAPIDLQIPSPVPSKGPSKAPIFAITQEPPTPVKSSVSTTSHPQTMATATGSSKTSSTAAWASLLNRAGPSPPKGGKKSPSPTKSAKTGTNIKEAIPIDLEEEPPAPLLNPYAPAPGEAPHPFFMSAEARKTRQLQENQQKLQNALKTRQDELKSQRQTSTSAALHSFFAPRVKSPTSAQDASQKAAVNAENRAKWQYFGWDIPEFPPITYVGPPPSELPYPNEHIESRMQLEFDPENSLNRDEIEAEFAGTLQLYAQHWSLPPFSQEKSHIDYCAFDEFRSDPKLSDPLSPEALLDSLKLVHAGHLEIRKLMSLSTTGFHDTSTLDSSSKVPLLDIRAEDMAEHIALQQQQAAQRQVQEEENRLYATVYDNEYDLEDIQDLYTALHKKQFTKQNVPWTSRFAPMSVKEVCGNQYSAACIKEWLMRQKAVAESAPIEPPKSVDFFKKRVPSSLPKPVEASPPQQILENTMIIFGPTGCGKTSAVYAVAAELGLEVLEVNASFKRTGSNLKTMVEEATQSEHVGRDSGVMTILLFEEVDQSFPEDQGFLNALISLCEMTKRPIILTCEEVPKVFLLKLGKSIVREMRVPDAASIYVHLALSCLSAGFSLPPSHIVLDLVKWFKHDMRAIFNNLQFWIPFVSTFGWHHTISALAGLVASPPRPEQDPNNHKQDETSIQKDLTHGLCKYASNLGNESTSSVFDISGSAELSTRLSLLHRHYLHSSIPKASLDREVDPSSSGSEKAIELLRRVSLAADVISISESWDGQIPRDLLHDRFDTHVDLQMEINSYLHYACHSTLRFLPTPTEMCLDVGVPEKLYVEQGIMDDATESTIYKVSEAMIGRSGSKASRFEDLSMLHLIASLEDLQRLQNTKRRSYKSKIDWSRVLPLQRLQFVRALRLSNTDGLDPSNGE